MKIVIRNVDELGLMQIKIGKYDRIFGAFHFAQASMFLSLFCAIGIVVILIILLHLGHVNAIAR
jgi:hypothetical protein